VTATLRQQLGMPTPNTKPDLTAAGLDFAHLEQDKLRAEQVRDCGAAPPFGVFLSVAVHSARNAG
jgi:hypothetical protein